MKMGLVNKAEQIENKESKDDNLFGNAGDIGALKINFLLCTRTTRKVPCKIISKERT